MRRGTVGEIGLGRELALEVPEGGPWLVLAQAIDALGPVAPQISLVHSVPGGGYAFATRPLVAAGTALTIPGAGRAVIADPAAINNAYRVSIVISPAYPPRWGLRPERLVLAPAQSLPIEPPAYSERGRIALVSGSLASPTLASGHIEIPPIALTLVAGQAGAEVLLDWAGWL